MNIPVTDLDMQSVQHRAQETLTQVQHLGRKATLAYVGLWGLLYDTAKGRWAKRNAKVDEAEARGEQIAQAVALHVQHTQAQAQAELVKLRTEVAHRYGQLEGRAAVELQKWRSQLRPRPQMVRTETTESNPASERAFAEQVEQVVARLGLPSKDQLAQLSRELEALHDRLDQPVTQTVTLPVANYAQMNTKAAISALAGLTVPQLETLRRYEEAHGERVTVLRAIDERVAKSLAVA
jgi:hypothetical protein